MLNICIFAFYHPDPYLDVATVMSDISQVYNITHANILYLYATLYIYMYGTSHKKVSTVTAYVTLLDHYLFSTYNSITCVLRLMLSVHTHAYYEVRIRYGIQYAQHVACKLSVQREGRAAKA